MNLISEEHRKQNEEMFRNGHGGSGKKWAPVVASLVMSGNSNHFCYRSGIQTVLDYGSGQGTLKRSLEIKYRDLMKYGKKGNRRKVLIREYEPADPKKNSIPSQADLVCCLDVLEHVEPDCLEEVLKHIHALTLKFALVVICKYPSSHLCPDGTNSHKILENEHWWRKKIEAAGKWEAIYSLPTNLSKSELRTKWVALLLSKVEREKEHETD